MHLFAAALADGGFEVYAIDLPGHGDSSAGFTADRARSVIAQSLDRLGHMDVVVGHSLGAGLLLDLATERNLKRMVLLSPPPTPIGTIDLSHSLVVTGDWDIPAIRAFVSKLEGAERWLLPWTAHSSVVFNASQTRDIIRWMGGDTDAVRASSRIGWSVTLLVAAIILGVCLLPGRPESNSGPTLSTTDMCARLVLAATAGAIISRFFVVFEWLRLFATDYLLSGFFIIGMLVRPRMPSKTPRGVLISILAAGYVIVVVGLLAGSRFINFSLSDGRWLRFPIIALAGFPLFLFDQTKLKRSVMTGVLSRALIGASILTGALILNREAGFLVVIMHLVVLFWIALWFMTEVVRRHTGDPTAAAVFASLVQGWMFAAWFVTT